ncbi:MAG: hypothetical protein O2899_06060, partial [Bacteroidetes bacterium]|nr:hypothetical protein [Bacteroidota bacterium]
GAVFGGEFAGGRFHLVGGSGSQCHAAALPRYGFGDAKSKSLGRCGHQDHFSVECVRAQGAVLQLD